MLTGKLLGAVMDTNVIWVDKVIHKGKLMYKHFNAMNADNSEFDNIAQHELTFLIKKWALEVHGHELRTSTNGKIDVYSTTSNFKVVEGLDYRRTELEAVILYCERLI